MALTVLFCGVSTEAPFPLLRMGTSQPEAHQGSARLCFFYRPEVAFFSPVYSQFNAIKTYILITTKQRGFEKQANFIMLARSIAKKYRDFPPALPLGTAASALLLLGAP